MSDIDGIAETPCVVEKRRRDLAISIGLPSMVATTRFSAEALRPLQGAGRQESVFGNRHGLDHRGLLRFSGLYPDTIGHQEEGTRRHPGGESGAGDAPGVPPCRSHFDSSMFGNAEKISAAAP